MKDFPLKVGWKAYEVKFCPGPEVNKEGDGEVYGYHHGGTREILVSEAWPREQQQSTLIHELIHSVDQYAGMQLEEAQILALGNLLYEVWKDNPALREALNEGFDKENPVGFQTDC